MTTRAIVSVHDVKPSTLPAVTEIVELLRRRGVGPVALLVVPGVGWGGADVETIRGFVSDGCHLAGHGWEHRAVRPRGVFHRLHAAAISRDQAEHLSRSTSDLRALVSRCHAWFPQAGLPAPDLYVPPAWALGRLSGEDLRALPFRWYTTLAGCVDAATGRLRPMALVGYEADNLVREVALRLTNGLNRGLARLRLDPLRIAIHPHDLTLRLADDVSRILDRPWTYTTVAQAMTAGPERIGPRAATSG